MSHNGLTKLLEECGELSQIAAKKIAFPGTDEHPDKKGSMKKRLEEEIADVIAACCFVADANGLDPEVIINRTERKINRFKKWHGDPNV